MKTRYWFSMTMSSISAMLLVVGLVHDWRLGLKVTESIDSCEKDVASRFKIPIKKNNTAITVRQTILLEDVADVEFPIGMGANEIRHALEVKFPGVELPLLDASESRHLQEKKSIKANYELLGLGGKNYVFSGPAGSSAKQVLTIAEEYFRANCQPKTIEAVSDERLNDKHRAIRSAAIAQRDNLWAPTSTSCAIFLFVLGMVPFFWYFLLNRLAEVAEAIRRK